MRLLVTGAGGLLGGRLAELLSASADVVAAHHVAPVPASLTEVALDLLSPASMETALESARPDAVVHSAALADADHCERDPELAERCNVAACEALARLCRARAIRLLALSTDLVFAGDRSFVAESDPALGTMVYARTKRRGEQAVLAEADGSAVLRVALVYGRGHGRRATASEAIAWALAAGRRMTLFTDQYRTPVDAESVADAIERLLRTDGAGLYHLGGPERLSRYELGLRVARQFGGREDLIEPTLQSRVLTLPRPADCSLDSSRAARELGWAPRPVDAALAAGRRYL